jgi:F-type H+-transporting ATPase subunit b
MLRCGAIRYVLTLHKVLAAGALRRPAACGWESIMRRSWPTFLYALVAVLIADGAAFAADDHKPNITEPRFDLTIWSIIIFVILFLVLRKFAWGPILEGLKKREASIESAIDEAKKVREEMARAQADFQRQLAEANQEIPRLLEEARRDAERLKEEMRAQAAADINAERQRLRREIDVAKDQALQEIWGQAANLATVISAQAIRRSLSPDDHRRLVDEALAQIQDLTAKNQDGAVRAGLEWVRQAGGKL